MIYTVPIMCTCNELPLPNSPIYVISDKQQPSAYDQELSSNGTKSSPGALLPDGLSKYIAFVILYRTHFRLSDVVLRKVKYDCSLSFS